MRWSGEHDFTSFAAVDAEKGKGLNHEGHEGTRRNSAGDNVREIFVFVVGAGRR